MALQVWLPLNGNLNNQGLTDTTVTNSGAVVDDNGKIGKCYSIGTAASGLSLSNTSMESFTSECSVSFWINILSWNTSYATFFQAGKGGRSWTDYVFGVLRNSTGSNLCFTITQGSSSSNASFKTPNLDLNTWYHLTFVYKTEHCLIYVNGVLYQDNSTSLIPSFSSISKVSIGRANDNQYQSNCKLNDFRIYNHALSANEVKELSKGLVRHYPLCNNSQVDANDVEYDVSGLNNHGTVNGILTYSSSSARYNISTAFDGTASNYISASSLPLETKTISCWLKCSLGSAVAVADYNTHLGIGLHGTDAIITYVGSSNGGTGSRVAMGSNWKSNEWNHVAVVATENNGRDVYLNGIKLSASSVNYWTHTTDNLMIGRRSYSSYYFNGQLSDFRAYATALSAEDIKALYQTSASIANNGTMFSYEFIEETE